jgi:hypothetical protein
MPAGLADGTRHYSDFIGSPVTVEVPQFSRTAGIRLFWP